MTLTKECTIWYPAVKTKKFQPLLKLKKQKQKQTNFTNLRSKKKKKNQPDPEIQWNGNFWRKKIHPPLRLKKKQTNKQTKHFTRPQLPCPRENQMVRP